MMDLQLFFRRRIAPADILARWGAAERRCARKSLLVDFAFMPAYALFGAGSMLLLSRYPWNARCQALFFYASVLPLCAWIFDILENTASMKIIATPLGAYPTRRLLGVARFATTLKWMFLVPSVVVIAYWLIVKPLLILRRSSIEGTDPA